MAQENKTQEEKEETRTGNPGCLHRGDRNPCQQPESQLAQETCTKTNMNTPETDAELIIMGRTECDHYVLAEFARRLERERDEARAELENLKAASIHTCHDQCRRPMCVLRRERDEAKKTAVMLAGELAAARRDLILAKREAK